MQSVADWPCNEELCHARRLLGEQDLSYGVMQIMLPQEIRKKACCWIGVDIAPANCPRAGQHIHLEFNKRKLHLHRRCGRELFLLLTHSQLTERMDEAAVLLGLADRDDEYSMETLHIVFCRLLGGDPSLLSDE